MQQVDERRHDLRPLPLSERRRVLHTMLPAGSPAISGTLSVEGRGCELFALMCTHDLEGIVAKRLADPYRAAHEMAQDQEPGLHAEGRQKRVVQRAAVGVMKPYRGPRSEERRVGKEC